MKERYGLLVIGAIVTFVVAVCVLWFNFVPNHAIMIDESIQSCFSDIHVQEKARYDTVLNLADCVKSYDKHEADTLKDIAESMSNGTSNGSEATTVLNAVTYNYPELKSDANYQKFMDTLTLCEQKIAKYRETYNNEVRKYNTYCRRFPNKQILHMMGYEIISYERLNFDVSADAPTGLFGED